MQAMEIQALSVCAHYFSQQSEREREREREAACRQQRLLQAAVRAACTRARAFHFNSVHLITRIARVCAGRKFWILK
jgi:hypothetical protein